MFCIVPLSLCNGNAISLDSEAYCGILLCRQRCKVCCLMAVSNAYGGRQTMCMATVNSAAGGRHTMNIAM